VKEREGLTFQGVPYLKRGDSAIYIEQFLGKDEPLSPLKSEINVSVVPPPAPPIVHEQPKE